MSLQVPGSDAAEHDPERIARGINKRASLNVAFDKALDTILKLDSYDLSLEDDSLVVVDRTTKKRRNRHCGFCFGPSSRSSRKIPLYNILWASLSPDGTSLVIDYAQPAKSRLSAAALTIPLPTPLDLPAGALESWIEALLSRAYGPVPRRRRAYVLVNPHAGPGGADAKWEAQVRPLFAAARMEMTVVTTEYSGQAVELSMQLDADAYDIIVPCSGDGLPHEIFNGLGRRADARQALSKLAVCHIPCGSGNAMSLNLYGTHKPSHAALAIVKGVSTPMDLVSVTQGDRRILSFLSQAVGIVADVDLGTEHLRWMGEARFTWGFFQRFLAKKVYPCDLAVKVEIANKDDVRAHYARMRSGSHELLAKESVASTSDAASRAGDDGLPPLSYGSVADELPAGWESVPYEKLGNLYCGNMTFMAPGAPFFPAALINDGLMDLVTVNGDIPVTKSLQMFLSVEKNEFFDNPLVNYRKISGFRIIPRNQSDGYISIDGERIPFGPFQVEVHQGLGTVLTKRGAYEAPGPKGWERIVHTEGGPTA